jgi:hypothetical protein
MVNYLVILFKNKKKKRIINKFVTIENCDIFFKKLCAKSSEVIFNVEYENGSPCKYELALIEINSSNKVPLFSQDELGRNIEIKLDDKSSSIIKIIPYNKEEKIFDIGDNKKITSDKLIRKYLSGDSLKVMSILNNKIIIQKDELISIFSLKNENECVRFIECISRYFISKKRVDCMFVTDTSSPQKKYLLKILNDYGFDKKILYRKYTTHPRPK